MSLFEATATRIQFLFSPANVTISPTPIILELKRSLATDQTIPVVSQDVSPQLQCVIAILVDYLNPNFTD